MFGRRSDRRNEIDAHFHPLLPSAFHSLTLLITGNPRAIAEPMRCMGVSQLKQNPFRVSRGESRKYCILCVVSVSFRLTPFRGCSLLSWVGGNCSGRVTPVLLHWRKQQGPSQCLVRWWQSCGLLNRISISQGSTDTVSQNCWRPAYRVQAGLAFGPVSFDEIIYTENLLSQETRMETETCHKSNYPRSRSLR